MSGSISLTDPTMTSAQWAQFANDPRYQTGAGGGGNPVGVPSSQWGPFGLTPPPGSPAAHDYWMNLQYGDSPPSGAVPMDPSQYTDMYERMTANTSHFGGGMQVPVGVQGSQFNPTQGNPNFTINDAGYGVLTDTGQNNLANYAQNALQSIYANAAKNRSGLSGFLGTPAGAAAVLGFPFAVGGGVAALGGAGGALGAGDVAAGTTVGDVAAGGGGAAAGAGGSGGLSGLSGLSGLDSLFGNLTGSLPSWVSPTLRGLSLLSRIASLAMQQNRGAGPTVSASGAGPTAGGR